MGHRSAYELAGGRLLLDGTDLGVEVEPVARPRFYDEVTTDGIAMHRLARLHGADVLATTVVQTCVRYDPADRCRYCSIEESLRSGATTRVKTPAPLAEVAEVAVTLDGVRHMVMTTGTAASADRGARYLARCAAAVKAAVPGLPIQVQCEPPEDLDALDELADAGADAIGIHVESLDDSVRARWLPGKATVPLAGYWAAWHRAVAAFGPNRVSTYLLVGLGEDPDQLVAGAARLIAVGSGPDPSLRAARPGVAALRPGAVLPLHLGRGRRRPPRRVPSPPLPTKAAARPRGFGGSGVLCAGSRLVRTHRPLLAAGAHKTAQCTQDRRRAGRERPSPLEISHPEAV